MFSWLPLIILTLFSLVIHFVTTFIVLLPHTQESANSLSIAAAVAMLLLFQLLFGLFAVSAIKTILTAPGEIPSWLRSDGKSDLHSYSNLLQCMERKRDGSPRFCRKTGAYKPDRTHFCREVRRCVLQFQHFSAPLNSAIGFHNYKYYLLTSFYGVLCCTWVLAATLPEVIAAWPPLSAVPAPSEATGASPAALALGRFHTVVVDGMLRRDTSAQWVVDAAILATLVLAAIALVPLTLTLVLHLCLIARGRTYHEWRAMRNGRRKPGRSIFDYGLLNNYALTLGVYPLLWCVPSRTGVDGNGIFYPEQERVQ